MKRTFFTVIAALVLIANQAHAGIVTFGSGANSFNMEFVTIGDAGNAADTTGNPNPAGSVAYEYQMGKYEVSRGMIDAYNAIYGNTNSLSIAMADLSSFGGNGADRPGTGITWNEAARFVNWLNTSQGYSAAYNFATSNINDGISLWGVSDAGYDAANPYRNSGAVYVLPTVDEWYKAAFYDPATDTWRQYASLDGNAPTAVASGTADNTAVYAQTGPTGPADVTQAGGGNAYGVVGMSGNVWEWEETSGDLTNSSGGLTRGSRGGSWDNVAFPLSSASRDSNSPTFESVNFGFRVVSLSTTGTVPEPTTFAIWGVMGLAGFGGIRRRRNRSQQDETSQVSES